MKKYLFLIFLFTLSIFLLGCPDVKDINNNKTGGGTEGETDRGTEGETGGEIYILDGVTHYIVENGKKIKTLEQQVLTYNYTDARNNYNESNQTSYDSSTGEISAYYDLIRTIRTGNIQENYTSGEIYNADGTKYYSCILEQTIEYYGNTNILISVISSSKYTYFTGSNAGQIIENSPITSNYIITVIELSDYTYYKVEMPNTTMYSIYKYYTDNSYSVEFYNNSMMTNKIEYTPVIINGKIMYNLEKKYDSNNILTSYTNVQKNDTELGVNIECIGYDIDGNITFIQEYRYKKD